MTSHRSASAKAWTIVLAFTLMAAACGGGDDATDPAPDTGGSDTTADAGGSDTGDTDTDGSDTDTTTGGDAMTPQVGGSLTYLLEAETDTWDIPDAACVTSCMTVMRAIADPLTIINEAGEVEPFALESIEPNDDYTMFTLTMRDGIVFHDGTPADGAALQRNLVEMAGGLLQGQVLADLSGGPDGITLVDDMTVTVEFDQPFATFPANIAERTGYLLAPSFWDDPDRASSPPIGTGPFVMTEWTPGERTVAQRNPDYWRSDANGQQLPYLDEIVFRPVADSATRRATMEAGDADANMDTFAENRDYWLGEWTADGNGTLDQGINRETTYLLLHTGKAPFDSPEMREALAMCTDREEYIAFQSPGDTVADGPFAEGAIGFLDDPGFPAFDPEAANEILDRIGRPEVITYGTSNVAANVRTAEYFRDTWGDNCGLNVVIDDFDQRQLVTRGITGNFEVFLWRNHGQGHPGMEFIWWHSRHASEPLALNFGRIVDPDLDALLEESWTTTDPATLQTIAEDINREFASDVYNIWLSTTQWINPYRAGVHGIGDVTLPSGNRAQPVLVGRTWLAEAWVES